MALTDDGIPNFTILPNVACATTLAIGYQKKWAPEKILAVATEFASRICEIKGAIPSSKQLYKKFKQVVKDTNFSK